MSNPRDSGRNGSPELEDLFELEPPSPTTEVTVDQPEKVGSIVLVDPEAQRKHAETAQSLLDDLLDTPLHSPEFRTALDDLTRLGEGTMQRAGDSVNRMLQRPAAALSGSGADPAARTGRTLGELRQIVTELDRERHDVTGGRRTLRFLPRGGRLQRNFQKYETAQDQLNAITKALKGGQDELRQDNAAIQTERDALWEALGQLADVAVLAHHLGDGLEQRIAALRTQGRSDDAATLESDALLSVRRRHQDLMTQMAVAMQGYLALDVVRRNNVELIKGVDRALDTTMAALRVAVITSQALGRQRIVLAQVDALNATTSEATMDLEKLQRAFDDVFHAMDEIDRYNAEATRSMRQTVTVLEGQVRRARLQLERSRSSDAATADLGRS